MLDSFGRKHDYLRLSLTDKCNLRCSYCMPHEDMNFMPHQKLMTHDEILSLAEQFVNLGVKKIRLTGGEPLVRKDFDKIFKSLSQLDVSLHLTTNAVTLHKHLDHLIKHGLKDINISLDTLQRQRFKEITRRDNANIVIQNIRRSIDAGLTVKINTVLLKDVNEAEIIDLINFTRFNKVDVRFIEFMPFDKNQWSASKTIGLADILEISSEHFPTITPILGKKNDTSKNYKVAGHRGTFGVISTVTAPFCNGCNRIRVTADGKMKNCLFSNNEVDLLSAIRSKQSISPLVKASLLSKKEARGGLVTQDQMINNGSNHENRTMIAIGG